MSKEIVMAGVKYNNKVYDGFNHGECFKKLPTEANMVNVEQGFITNDGEFVDREKAFTIARKAHQLEYDYGIQKTLISEDIHINWLHKKDKTIADLEAKLAESEKDVEFYQERYSDATTSAYGADLIAKNIQNRLEEEIRELKQQLAEKEKEIENLKHFKVTIGTNKNNQVNISSTTYIDQDKISFAVEKLEKVKETLIKNANPIGEEYEEDYFNINVHSIKHFINNQIEELKKENENESLCC